MQFQFSFKNMQPELSLQNYAQTKLQEKLEKFGASSMHIHLTFETDKNQQIARCSLQDNHGMSAQAEETSYDMHATIDCLVDKLIGQLRKKKEKQKDHRAKDKHGSHAFSKKAADGDGGSEIDADDVLKYERSRRKV